jgi:hypothetical protein
MARKYPLEAAKYAMKSVFTSLEFEWMRHASDELAGELH